MQDPIVFATIEDWLKVVVPHFVLAAHIEVKKTALSSGHPVAALACKRCCRQNLDLGECANHRHTTHLCAGYSNN